MNHFNGVCYVPETGRICGLVRITEGQPTFNAVEYDNPVPEMEDTHWVKDMAVIERPGMNISVPDSLSIRANGVDEFVLNDIPVGAQINVFGSNDMTGTSNGDPAIFTFATPGRFEIVITKFPMKDFKVIVHAI